MKKQETLDRWSQYAEARSDVLTEASMNLARIAETSKDDADRIMAFDSIIALGVNDAANDQREIANLIAVVNSEQFEVTTRLEARRRVSIMLELPEDE